MREICIVEFTATPYAVGSLVYADGGDYDFWLKDFDDTTDESPVENRPDDFHSLRLDIGKSCLKFNTDNWGFGVQFVGDGSDVYANSLEYEVEALGAEDVFCDFKEEIMRLVLAAYNKDQPGVRLLTLWEYEVYHDYEGDTDSDWNLLGRLDTSCLKVLTSVPPAELPELDI